MFYIRTLLKTLNYMLQFNSRVKIFPIFIRFLPVFIIVVALSTFFGLGMDQYLNFQNLQTNRENLIKFVADSWVLAIFLYILIYALVVALSIPFGAILTLTGGFLFGPIYGALFAIIAANCGAFIIFSLAKTSLGDLLWNSLLSKLGDHKLGITIRGLQKNALFYMFFLRLFPIVPFYIANLLPAFTGVRPRIYVLGTFIGIIPGTLAYSFLGSGLGEIFENQEKISLNSLVDDTIFYALGALAVLSICPIIYKIVALKNPYLK